MKLYWSENFSLERAEQIKKTICSSQMMACLVTPVKLLIMHSAWWLLETLMNHTPVQVSHNRILAVQIQHINGIVQDCSNSIALAMELLQSCTSHQYRVETPFCTVYHNMISHRSKYHKVYHDMVLYIPGPQQAGVEHWSDLGHAEINPYLVPKGNLWIIS